MKTSQNGINLIKNFEGCELEAYKPTANDVWTIGYGHTSGVKQGDKITRLQAETFLTIDLQRYECAVNVNVLPKCDLTQNEFDALVSLCFNIGISNFSHSTLLKLLREGKKKEAANQFDRWIYQGKTVLPGLVKRRQKEKELFLRPSKWQQMVNYLD